MTAKIIIDKDKLYDLYINQNKSVEEVSIILNNTIRSIRKNLRRYNIKKNINLITIKRKEFCLKNME